MSTKAQVGLQATLSIGSVTGTASGSETFTLIGEVESIDFDGGSRTINDATHLQSTGKEKVGGIFDWGKISITYNRIGGAGDPG
jgi:hypothetical protein